MAKRLNDYRAKQWGMKYYFLIALFLFILNDAFFARDRIRVVMDNNYPPYTFLDSKSRPVGILIDQWKLWQKKTGIAVNLVTTDWKDALDRMRQREFDVIDTIFFDEERQKWLDFGKPYVQIEVPLIYSEQISGISGFESLREFVVGVKSGDVVSNVLKKNGVHNLVFYSSYEDIVKAAKEMKIMVFTIDKPPALYFLNKYKIAERFREAFLIDIGQFHRAVHKGEKELLNLVEKGFARISAEEYRKIDENWMGKRMFDLSQFRIVLIVIVLWGVISLLLIAFNILLQKKVRLKTTELARSEEKFRAVFEQNFDSCWLFSKTGLIIDANCQALHLCNLKKGELIGKYFWDLPFIADNFKAGELIKTGFKQALEKEVISFEVELCSSVQKVVNLFFSLTPIYNAENQVNFVFVQARNIDDLKRAQRDQIELERRLFDLQRIESLGALSAGIAHQFNDLFMVIIGNLSLALSRISDEEWVREKTDSALAAAHQGAKIIALLLSYVGEKRPELKPLDMKEFIQRISILLTSLVPRNVRLIVDSAQQLPVIFGDPLHLQQVLINVVGNAVEAIGSKNCFIRISCTKGFLPESELKKNIFPEKLSPGEYLIISVEDNGSGIAPENLKRIIEPYFTTKFTGRGMGLAVVAGIIKAHHGGLIVSSIVGVGTSLKIILPVALAESVKETGAAVSEFENSVTPFDLQGRCVLVVDDEQEVVFVITNILKSLGARVEQAFSGREAVETVSRLSQELDLIILDHLMPEMNGLATLKEIRAINPAVKVVVTSGIVILDISVDYHYLNVSAFLSKPFYVEELKAVLKKVLFPKKEE